MRRGRGRVCVESRAFGVVGGWWLPCVAAGPVVGWPAAGAGGMACGAVAVVPGPVIFWPGLLARVYVCARVICWSWARMIGGPGPSSWAGPAASSARVHGRGYACRGDLLGPLPGWPAAAGHPGPRVEIQKFSPENAPAQLLKKFSPYGGTVGPRKIFQKKRLTSEEIHDILAVAA